MHAFKGRMCGQRKGADFQADPVFSVTQRSPAETNMDLNGLSRHLRVNIIGCQSTNPLLASHHQNQKSSFTCRPLPRVVQRGCPHFNLPRTHITALVNSGPGHTHGADLSISPRLAFGAEQPSGPMEARRSRRTEPGVRGPRARLK